MSEIKKSIWINAVPEVVFDYFTDAEKTVRWSGLEAEIDAVPAGVYRLNMGSTGWVTGKFLKVEPPHFISWEVYLAENEQIPVSSIEISLTAEAGGTRVEVRQLGLAAPFDRMASRGLDHHLARLSVAAQNGDPGNDSLCERELDSLAV